MNAMNIAHSYRAMNKAGEEYARAA